MWLTLEVDPKEIAESLTRYFSFEDSINFIKDFDLQVGDLSFTVAMYKYFRKELLQENYNLDIIDREIDNEYKGNKNE